MAKTHMGRHRHVLSAFADQCSHSTLEVIGWDDDVDISHSPEGKITRRLLGLEDPLGEETRNALDAQGLPDATRDGGMRQ
jgi:hypothetical protein